MGIPTSGCAYTSNVNGAQRSLTPATCATMLLDYTFAQPTFNGMPNDFSFVSRAGNAFGSIYHATPQVVGPPGSLLQDPGYVGFAASASPGWGARKTVVYVATNDGLLHAFWTDETKLENNELWAMLLPGVMSNINGGSYPSNYSFLLDGTPIVKDVVWDRSVSNASDPTVWHTMLVAGYGPSQTGYYAVDVTNPDPTGMTSGANPPPDPAPVGPVFRWQLTKMPATNMPLFGSHSATPAVTTLYMNPNDGGGPREIGVAILPGGEDVVPTTQTTCQRWPKSSDSAPVGAYTARNNVRCWGQPTPPATTSQYTDFVLGRSVSIVRVDTGEVLRVFARKNDYQAYPSDTIGIASRFTDTPLDSPMTGTPVVYPSDIGTDTTKFFISDADGTIWRFDLSSSDPSQWSGELYLDLYNQTVDTSSTAWSDGQPVQVPPVLSLDPVGQRGAQRGERHDRPVRHDGRRVRLLGHREGRDRAHAEAARQRQLVDAAGDHRHRARRARLGADDGLQRDALLLDLRGGSGGHTIVQRGDRTPLGTRLRHAGRLDVHHESHRVQPLARRSARDAAASAQPADDPRPGVRRAGRLRCDARGQGHPGRLHQGDPRLRQPRNPGARLVRVRRVARCAAELRRRGLLALHAGRREGHQRRDHASVRDSSADAGIADAHRLVGGGDGVRRTAAAGLVVAGLLSGCARHSAPAEDAPAPPLAAVPSALPADHLAPDELVEGKERAFGVALPRGLAIEQSFVDVVHASGPMTIHALVTYFRPRLKGGSLREGEKSATFEHVTASGSPPDTELSIHFSVFPGKTLVDITATPQHAGPTLPDNESRWREVGLSPTGKILDPTHLH